MALTGRAALLAALGSIPVGILEPSWTGMLAVNGPLALACALDYTLAVPVRTLTLARSGDTSVRLGEHADVHLTLTNPGTRKLRARVRDAWPPSSWRPGTESAASRHTVSVPRANAGGSPPGWSRPAAATAEPTASRSVPSVPWDCWPARAPTPSRGRSGSCPRSPAASTSRPGWPACANWTAVPAS